MNDSNILIDTPASSQETSTDTPSGDPSQSAVAVAGRGGMFKKRAKTTSVQKGLRKPVTSISSATPITISDDDSEDEDSAEEHGTRPSAAIAGRKRKRGGILQALSTRQPTAKEDLGVSYDVSKGSDTVLDPKSQATATSAEFDEDQLLGRTKSSTSVESSADNLYRGQKGYRQLVPKREQITTKYNAMGPQKAASNIRMTTLTDYAPGMFLSNLF